MRISRIEYLGSDAARIYLDGHPMGEVDAADVFRLGLMADMELDEEGYDRLMAMSETFTARRKAAASLARADFSKEGLVRRLIQKGVAEEAAREAADYFESKGYINDREYAARLVRQYCGGKGYGRQRVEQELMARGLSREIIEESLDAYDEEEGENGDRILGLFNRRFSGCDLSDEKTRRRVAGALMRYGYRWEEIRALFERLSEEGWQEE